MTPEETTAAIAGAAEAAEATAELLRFAREGDHSDSFAFDAEVVVLLAGALRKAIAIELPRAPKLLEISPYDTAEALRQVDAAIARFLEDWA
jgi:hypothetical protein